MIAQIININSQFVFEKYKKKYSIFKDLRYKGYFGIEIRNSSKEVASELHRHILKNETFSYFFKAEKGIDLFTLGTFEQILDLASSVKSNIAEDIGHLISNVIMNYLSYSDISFIKKTNEVSLLMGILNVTPDSFSDGGKYLQKSEAIEHIEKLIADKADIIDIGGESSRPNAESIDAETELERLMPVLENLSSYNSAIFSIDTTKSIVAEEAIKQGIKIVNDISGFTNDPKMKDVVKKYNSICVVMHMKGNPKTMQLNPYYDDVVSEVYDFLFLQVKKLKSYGINKIIIDPGIGFGKSLAHNYELINRLEEFKGIGCPILIGLSRKSLIGNVFNIPVNERDLPTAILETISISKGAKIIRTHNVQNAQYVRKLIDLTSNPNIVYD